MQPFNLGKAFLAVAAIIFAVEVALGASVGKSVVLAFFGGLGAAVGMTLLMVVRRHRAK
jgi:hypothetical protein